MAKAIGKAVLIVEDERDIAELIRFNLEKEGYRCLCASDSATAAAHIQKRVPDLIILDRMLPGRSGDHVIAKLRADQRTSEVPVLMLTARVEETDQLVGFALGASDYVTKPFSMKILVARVAALLRRGETTSERSLMAGPIRLDHSRHEVTVAGKPLELTAREFRILHVLMASDGRVLNRSQLIDQILGAGGAVTDRSIDVHIVSLRKKLGPAKEWIQTVHGIGYTFRNPQNASAP